MMIRKFNNTCKNLNLFYLLCIVFLTLLICSCMARHKVSREICLSNLPLVEDCIKKFINDNPYNALVQEFMLTTDSLRMGSYQELEKGVWHLGKWIIYFTEGIETPTAHYSIVYKGGAFDMLIFKLQKTENKYRIFDWDVFYGDPEYE